MVIYLRRATVSDIARLTDDPAGYERFVFEEGDQATDLIDFDKAWAALHHMLTGDDAGLTEHPLGIVAEMMPIIGTDEHGFGGFSIISPNRMARFDAALRELPDAVLAARYDPPAMAAEGLYLSDVFEEEGDDALDYVLQGVPALRRFSAACAAAGDGAMRILA